MNSIIKPLLDLTHEKLSKFASLEDFWQQFDQAFGTQYDRTVAVRLHDQWQAGDFSQLPQIEILDSSILGDANGAYASSSNKIYLSASFVDNARPEAIGAFVLQGIGRFVSTQINQTGRGGDQGAVFGELVEGQSIDAKGLSTSNILSQQDGKMSAAPQKVTSNSSNTTPLEATSVASGDYRIDSLLGGNKWGVTTISYSFFSGGTYYGSEAGLAPVSNAVQNNVRNILNNVIAPLINLNFVEVSDSSSSYGQIRYLLSTDLSTNGDYAYAYYPFATDTNQGNIYDIAGDVFLNPSYDNSSTTDGFQGGPGTHGYQSIIHETLHALGIKHPGNYNGSGVGDPPYLPSGEENWDNTLMTYNFSSGAEPSTPMAYDVMALQYLYGAKSFNSSNTTYTFTKTGLYSDGLRTVGSSTLENKITIWDSGGTDTLNFSGLGFNSTGYRFDINAGGWLTTQTAFNGTGYNVIPGPPVSFTSGTTYLATTSGTRLAYGVSIENLVNSSSNDYIIANSAANVFSGYGFATATGNDSIEGANNLDTLDLSAFTSASVTQTQSGNNLVLGLGSGRSVTVKDYYTLPVTSRINLQFSTLGTLSISKTTDGAETGSVSSVFTLSRTGNTASALSVNYSLTGTATAGSDYTNPGAGIATFAAGSSTAIITLPTIDDAVVDPNETITATITAPTGYSISGSNTASATIVDNDLGTISISKTADGAETGSVSSVFTLSRTGNTASALSVNYSLTGTATAGSDYTNPGAGIATFAAGSSTAIITLPTIDDAVVDPNETIIATITPPTGYTISGSNTASATIVDNDLGTLSISKTTDGAETGSVSSVFTLSRTGNTASALSVNYSLTGTATAGSDYTNPGAGIATFAAGSSTAIITLPTIDDAVVDPNETIIATITAPTGYTISGSNTASATIADNDTLPSITLSLSLNSVSEDGTTNLAYTFTRTGSTTNALTVNYGVAGTATFNNDYIQSGAASFTGTTGTITFAAGASTATLTIDPTADTTIESNETVALTLASGTGYTIGTTTAIQGTILNDDLGTISISKTTDGAETGTVSSVFTVTRTGDLTSALSVNYSLGGTATVASDYTNPGAGIATFAAGSSTAIITLPTIDDAVVDPNETITATITPPTGYTISGSNTASAAIADNDIVTPSISLVVAPTSVTEDGTTNLIYTFTRNGNTSTALTVNYAVGGTATFNTDYTQTGAASFTATTGTVIFAAGASTVNLIIDPTADTTIESDETVAVRMVTGTGYTIGTAGAKFGTITNDDFPAITLAVAQNSVTEDGTTNLVYTFTRNGNTSTALTVNYAVGGTATFNTDYTQTGGATFTATTGTITFAAGSATATLTIDPTADTTIESDETVALTLASGTGYTIGTTTAVTGTITNDDFATLPTLSIAKTTDGAETGAVGSVFTVTRTGDLTSALSVNYSLGGTATVGSDYTDSGAGIVTFAAGSSTAIITLPTIDDAVVDPNETISATITAPTGYTISGSNSATATIVDNDTLPSVTLSLSPNSVTEDGTTNLGYTFTRTGDITNALTVNYGVAGTATFNSDYVQSGATSFTGTTGNITFAAGSATAILTINPGTDTTIESDETVAVTLTTGTDYTIGTTTAVTGTITNDDLGTLSIAKTTDGAETGAVGSVFTVIRTGDLTSALSVNYSLGGTATAGSDYTDSGAGIVTFAAGSATATITLSTIDDAVVDPNETITATITAPSGYNIAPPTVISAVDTGWYDNSGNHDPNNTNYLVGDNFGQYRNWMAFNLPNFSQAVVSAQLQIRTYSFSSGDASETYELRDITTPISTLIAGGSGLTGIYNDLGDGIIYGSRDFTTADNNQTVTINLNSDLVSALNANSGQSFGLGGWISTLDAIANNEYIYGSSGSFSGSADPASKVQLLVTYASDPNIATATIADNDVFLPTISLDLSPTSVNEDGSTNLVYTFTRSGNATNALTVNYGVGGTAAFNSDYSQIGATSFTGTTGTITFAAGANTATLTIDPTADTTIENDETVALTLTSGTGYGIGTTTAVTGTITNDDFPIITVAATDASAAETATGITPNPGVFTLTRTGSTTNALTVNYTTAGTATNGTDYTTLPTSVTFAAGSSTATVTVNPIDDSIFEGTETAILTLGAGTGYTLGTAKNATVNIADNDSAPITINFSANQTIVEGKTSPQNATYTVTLSNTSTQAITVQYATSDGTGIAGLDYTNTTGTLTFNPGIKTQVINIPILNDSINEADETFSITLTSPTNANLGTNTTVNTTITDTFTASVTTILPVNVENLTLTGTGNINGTGNVGNNVITGNSGNNIFYASQGVDTLIGGFGNDTYSFVATTALGTDTIIETTTGDIDTINFSSTTTPVKVNLGLTASQTVNSNLKLILSANNVIENATGGTGNDRLTGNTLNNTLSGGNGNDQLLGLTGDDTLWGGLGDDVLTGDIGSDKYLFQGSGVFTAALGVDYITQFEAGQDQIVLSKTTFNAISNNVGEALTDFAVVTDDELVDASDAHIVFSQTTGSLFYNQNGNVLGATAVFEFAYLGNADIPLSSSDFSLVS